MRDQPDGLALLDVARQVLREEVMELLPADKRLPALMVANALGIAARQMQAGDVPARDELAGLERLLCERVEPIVVHEKLQEPLVRLNRQLGTLIRNGKADPETALHAQVVAHLRMIARQTLSESNPKYLEHGA